MPIPPLWIFKMTDFWKICCGIIIITFFALYYSNNNQFPFKDITDIMYVIVGLIGLIGGISVLYTKYLNGQFNKKIRNQQGIHSFITTITFSRGRIQYQDKARTKIDLYVYILSFRSDLGEECDQMTGISSDDLSIFSIKEGISQEEFLNKYFSPGSILEVIQDQTYPKMMKIILPYQTL